MTPSGLVTDAECRARAVTWSPALRDSSAARSPGALPTGAPISIALTRRELDLTDAAAVAAAVKARASRRDPELRRVQRGGPGRRRRARGAGGERVCRAQSGARRLRRGRQARALQHGLRLRWHGHDAVRRGRPHQSPERVRPVETGGRMAGPGDARQPRASRREPVWRAGHAEQHRPHHPGAAVRRVATRLRRPCREPQLRRRRDRRDACVAVGGRAWRIYHCVNSGSTTWHGLGEAIARLLGTRVGLHGVAMADVPMRAPRPQYCALSNARLSALGVQMPAWQDALARHVRSLA